MDHRWLKNYPKGMPAEIKVEPQESILTVYEASCQKYKDNIAFTCHKEGISYEQLWELSSAFASYCQHELKLNKGDRIAIMMPNLLQYPVAVFGAFQAGLVVVNLNPLDRGPSLEAELSDSGARAIVVLENFVTELEKVLPNTKLEKVIITSVGAMYPAWKRAFIDTYLRHVKKVVPEWHLSGSEDFLHALELGRKKPYQKITVVSQDLAFLQFTGGTTGIPKGVMLSHGNMVANMRQAATWIMPVVEEDKKRIITALPLYHIFSLLANCLVFISIGGENVLIPDARNIPDLIKELRRRPFNGITAVNTLFNALLHHPDFAKIDFSALKISLGGGMAVQKAVADEWQLVTGCVICQAYGLSEASPAVTINPVNLSHFNGSIGLPIPSTLVSIQNPEGDELPVGEIGELCIQGPQVMLGYWNKPEETAKALKGGWLHTADGAYMDAEGYVYIVDRLKDMVIVSGFNVYPAEVEQVIKSMPGVNEVAVIGIPDIAHGEVVKAFIVLEKDAHLSFEEIKAYTHEKLAAYKCPREVEFCPSLPKSNVGKIVKKILREQEMTKARMKA